MTDEEILARRAHGLYITRGCEDITALARELMGLHCWFHRNVVFSALIRGAELNGWKNTLTKTWLYRGTLHGVAFDDLPNLLALHPAEGEPSEFEREVLRYMEDGVYSRAEFRKLFADRYDDEFISRAFSPWGGVFVGLARRGLVAFRDMVSRDFDMIDAEPNMTRKDLLPELLRRYFTSYGPATLADAAWFFGLYRQDARALREVPRGSLSSFTRGGREYFYDSAAAPGEIPETALYSGFDPIIVSYTDRSAVLPNDYKRRVILSSGICLPTIAVHGRVAGIWNIKSGAPTIEFFEEQPKRIRDAARDMAESICWRAKRYNA